MQLSSCTMSAPSPSSPSSPPAKPDLPRAGLSASHIGGFFFGHQERQNLAQERTTDMANLQQPTIKVGIVRITKLHVENKMFIPVSKTYPRLKRGGLTWQVFVVEPFNLFLVDNNNLLLVGTRPQPAQLYPGLAQNTINASTEYFCRHKHSRHGSAPHSCFILHT